MLRLTKREAERWFDVRTTEQDSVVGTRLWSLGEALERAVRYVNRSVKNPSPAVIVECTGSQSAYSAQDILIIERAHDSITIKNVGA